MCSEWAFPTMANCGCFDCRNRRPDPSRLSLRKHLHYPLDGNCPCLVCRVLSSSGDAFIWPATQLNCPYWNNRTCRPFLYQSPLTRKQALVVVSPSSELIATILTIAPMWRVALEYGWLITICRRVGLWRG